MSKAKKKQIIAQQTEQLVPSALVKINFERKDDFKIQETHYLDGNLIFSRTYLAEEKYNELQQSKEILITQLKSLQKQVDENRQLRENLQHRIKILEEHIKKIEIANDQLRSENTKLNKYCDMFANEKIHQKFSELSKGLFGNMCWLLCSPNSIIYNESNISDIYQLCDILREIHFDNWKQNKWSIVYGNEQHWMHIYNSVSDLISKRYDINMDVFFDIVSLRNTRNNFSHPTEELKLDELRHISKYADQIWKLFE